MILSKYLINGMLKNQLFVLMLLFLVFFSQRFIRVLNLVVDSNISGFLIFVFFVLGIPEFMKLILPISLFVGILMTFNYLHLNNEIIAMYSCGIGNFFIIRGVLFLCCIAVFFSIINVSFLSPFCLHYQNELMLKYQSDFSVIKLFERQFRFINRLHSVFFVDGFFDKKFEGVFFAQIRPSGYYSIIVADRGFVERSFNTGDQWIVLSSGNCYFWDRDFVLYPNFYVNSFKQYKILITQNQRCFRVGSGGLVGEMFINRLWFVSSLESRVELHWRLTLIFVVFVMVLIIFPLSLIKLNSSYLLNVFPSVLLYLLFFLLQIFLRSCILKGYIDLIWIWIVNFSYILIAVVLNFWDSVIFRNLRWKLKLSMYE